MERKRWRKMDRKMKEGHARTTQSRQTVPSVSACSHRLSRTQFRPTHGNLIVCIYIVSPDIFALIAVYFNAKTRSREIWASSLGMLRYGGIQSAQRHSAIFQIAIDWANRSRGTFRPPWRAVSKTSLFLETGISRSL